MTLTDPAATAAEAFASLPHDHMPLSARVDFLHLTALGKPAARVKVPDGALPALERWCERHGYGWDADEEGYCCVARTEAQARHILEVDRRVEPHELELGLLLGYPRCCCEAIARLGESRIDEQALVVARWEFEGPFRLINPSRYRQGGSLICHLPCSPICARTLEIASRACRFIRPRLDHPAFATWSGSLL